MSHYQAYGLNLSSELPLPELIPASADLPVDVQVSLGTVEGPLPATEPRLVQFDEEGAYLAWPTIGRFRIDSQYRITIEPLTQDHQRIRFALLGPVLGCVLQLRAIPLLHGSAVAFEGKAIAFVGRKHAGKSTIAAACVAAGCAILSDDVLPLEATPSSIFLVAGFPALKLEASMHRASFSNLSIIGSPAFQPGGKVLVTDGSRSAPRLPVGAVIVLQPDAPPESIQLTGYVALQELLQHGYALKFADPAFTGRLGPKLFEACARLVRTSLILGVGRPADMNQLIPFVSALLARCSREHSPPLT